MNYVVDWMPAAESDLAAVWVAADDQDAVAEAAEWIDRRLGRAPLTFGESQDSSVHRVGHYPPLGVEFEVIEDDKRVLVQAVWAID
jgi:hypothetical protein